MDRVCKAISLLLGLLLLATSAWAKPFAPIKLDVKAEHQKTKAVLVHEPGRGLGRVTRANAKQMLFEEPVSSWGKARAEHQELQALLKSRGVEVVKVHDLLKDVLDKPVARLAIVEQALRSNPKLDGKRRFELGKLLAALPSHQLAEILTEGLTQDELANQRLSNHSLWKSAPELVLPAHVNMMFTRDSTKVVGDTFNYTSMATELRSHETNLLRLVMKHHPRFAGMKTLTDRKGTGFDAIEGGDMLVIDKDTILVGVGERTKSKAVLAYAKELFQRGLAKNVVMTGLPNKGSMFHTDTIMNRVSEDHMVIHPVVKQLAPSTIITPNGHGGVITQVSKDDLLDTIARVTGRTRSFKTIAPRDELVATREQELDGANVKPIADGTVIAYKHNKAYNAAMEKSGIEVLTFNGENLVGGRGGPHCLTRDLR